jgi:hypothetical protein
VSSEAYAVLRVLPSGLAEKQGDQPFVAIVRNREELFRWLRDPPPGLRWLQVEGMLADADAWTEVAHTDSDIPLDVVLSDPASEFSELYRLVDASAVCDIRVTVPVVPGSAKAVRLAAALRLPVRLLPGQPNAEALNELRAILDIYLHEPTVEAPVEFFHSLLVAACATKDVSLWVILEHDPDTIRRYNADGLTDFPATDDPNEREFTPSGFVEKHLKSLIAQGGECAACPWQRPCRGYFKWPDPSYSCEGIKGLFSAIETAGIEIRRDMADLGAARPVNSPEVEEGGG